MSRSGWRKADLVLVGAVASFVAIVAILGLNIPSLLLGTVTALVATVAARRNSPLAHERAETR